MLKTLLFTNIKSLQYKKKFTIYKHKKVYYLEHNKNTIYAVRKVCVFF